MSVSRIIVPDDVLDVEICDICRKYLSVIPVKVNGTKIVCGRCVKKETVDMVESYYGLFAELALFKCINHFDGCNKYLTCDEVILHEGHCRSEEYVCLLCPNISPKIPIYMLLHHVKTNHRKLFLKKNTFAVELMDLETSIFFHRIDSHFFFIKECFDNRRNLISLRIIGIGKHTRSLRMNVTYFIKLQDENIIEFESRTCGNYDEFDNVNNSGCTKYLPNAVANQTIRIRVDIDIPACTQIVQMNPTLSRKVHERQNVIRVVPRNRPKVFAWPRIRKGQTLMYKNS